MENISVCIRIRPKVKEDDTPWKSESNTIYNSKSKETFTFDKIIDNNTTNQDMFYKVIKDNLQSFIKGINMSVFAFGQTSTGKTFTMRGTDKNPGIIPLAIKEIFRLLEEDKSINKYTLKASYLELYNEQVNDLLNANNKNLEIRESAQKGVFVNNLTEVVVTNTDKAMQLLKQGDSVRVIAETKLNEKSSRSHSILRLSLEVNKSIEGNNNNNANDKKNKTLFAQMNLIDLAGSENVSKAKTDGIRMKEGSNINKSLLALSNVISKLSANPKSFVNFRDSKLTRLLQNGLSGNSKTTIICTISEAMGCYSETLNTLHFGNKAKNIKTDIKINELLDEKHKIMSENNELKNKIKLLEEMMKEKKQLEEKEKVLKSKEKQNKSDEDEEKNGAKSAQNDKDKKLNDTGSETQSGKNVGSFDKIFSEGASSKDSSEEEKNKEKMINALEREINILKRMLITNEEIGDEFYDMNNNPNANFQDNFSFSSFPNQPPQLGQINHPNAHLHMSANKYQKMSLMASAAKMPESAHKMYSNPYGSQNPLNNAFFEPDPMTHFNSHNQTSNSIYRRSMSMTEMKNREAAINCSQNQHNNSSIKNFALNNSSKKIGLGSHMSGYGGNNNNIMGSAYKNPANLYTNAAFNVPNQMNQINQFNAENDIEMILSMNNQNSNPNMNNNNNNYLENHLNQSIYRNPEFGYNNNPSDIHMINMLRSENDEIKKNYFELKSKFIEQMQIKENQIKSLTANMNMAMDNCEKLIREAEENYLTLKLSNERLLKDLESKDAEIKNLGANARNAEISVLTHKDEIAKLNSEISELKNKNFVKEIEIELSKAQKNCDNLKEENEALRKIESVIANENEKLKIENNHVKISAENFKSENLSYKTQVECYKKKADSLANENAKLKNDIESYKNDLNANKEKIGKMKSEVNSLKANLDKLQNELSSCKSFNKDVEAKENNCNSNNTNVKKGVNIPSSASGKNFNCNNNGNNNNLVKNANNKENDGVEKLKVRINELEKEIKNKNSHICLLEKENAELKEKLSAFDPTCITEYEKVVDESLMKIKDYDMKLNLANEKLSFYEKMLKISAAKEESYNRYDNETPMRSSYACPEKIVTNTINTNIVKISQSNTKNNLSISNTGKKPLNSLPSGGNLNLNDSFGSHAKAINPILNSGVSQFSCVEAEKDLNRSIIIQTPKQNENKNKVYNSKLNSNSFISPNKFQISESKEFLGKKRHLNKVYQNMIDNNLKSAAGDGNNTSYVSDKKGNSSLNINLKEEKENFKEACFSSFEI